MLTTQLLYKTIILLRVNAKSW